MKENTLYACPVPGDPLGYILLNRNAILNGHFPKGRLKKKKKQWKRGRKGRGWRGRREKLRKGRDRIICAEYLIEGKITKFDNVYPVSRWSICAAC